LLHPEIAAEPKASQLQVISIANSSDFMMSIRIFNIFPKALAAGVIMKHKDLSFRVFK